jgi:hypothetical protein
MLQRWEKRWKSDTKCAYLNDPANYDIANLRLIPDKVEENRMSI